LTAARISAYSRSVDTIATHRIATCNAALLLRLPLLRLARS
jgi:hypothetical protein